MTLPTGNIGGTLFVERQLLNILRSKMTDPGVDDPNNRGATGHGDVRDGSGTQTSTATAGQTAFVVVPTADTTAPIVAVYNVTINGATKKYGYDYLVTWGDKFGPQATKTCTVTFNDACTIGDTVVIRYKYGKKISTYDGKIIALGSWINSGFSRGSQPAPKITVQLESDAPAPVGIGDNWDVLNQQGAYWHDMNFRITIMSLYAEECKTLTDDVITTIMVAQHDDQFGIPEMVIDNVVNFDFDIDQKLFVRVVSVKIRSREIFG